MTVEKKKPYCPRIVSENDVGVHKSLGLEAQTCRVGIPRPMTIRTMIRKRAINRIPRISIRTVRMPISPIQQKPTLSNELAAPPIRLAVTQA